MYKKIVNDGYILCVGENLHIGIEITEEEYRQIVNAVTTKPIKDGYYYKLKDISLTWEEFEIIIIPETEATEADYISALEDLGVKFGG